MANRFDAIVVGCGGVGSAAAEHFASRGAKVLGVEQFELGHSRGSSHGRTRIIRQAYFEHPNYVPLLRDAYQTWTDLGEQIGKPVYHRTGLLEVGLPDGELIQGIRKSVSEHQLRVDEFSTDEARREFEPFHIEDECVAVFEHDAGYLDVDACVMAQIELARQRGATFVDQTPLRRWQQGTDGTFRIEAGNDVYEAESLIITAGSWSAQMLSSSSATGDSSDAIGNAGGSLPISVLKKHVHWFEPSNDSYDRANGCPIFYFETPNGHYYGFPSLDSHGVKVAEHSGGDVVPDPSHVDRGVDAVDLSRIESFLQRHLPNSQFKHHDHSVCFYSMSPDGHFIFDRHPNHANMLIAAGLSGHGFKFTRLLGQLLAEAILDQRWDPRVEFLGLNRFSRPA